MDMLEVMREATRIGHLDHSRDDWVESLPDRARRAPAASTRRRSRPARPPIW
jgi:hypothetical protein